MNIHHLKKRTDVAIIGMECIFPGASDLKGYRRLIFRGEDAVTDVPESHWSSKDFFDSDPKKPDHTYCKRGGFISPVSFDPAEFGIPPSILEATDTSQLISLMIAKKALENAGYGKDVPFNREKASVILGVTGTQELVIPLGARLGHPLWKKALESSGISPEKTDEVIEKISGSYVSWQENSFPGLLGNVVAGRICNRLDLGGTNCVVDAACASSMSALHLAVMELQSGRSDIVLTGGVDALNDIFMHMCFASTKVLSPTQDARPFSKNADGIVLGEGIGIFILKRLEDAEKDKDRIYAVIKGIGTSSDGKSQSIYAPRAEGQVKALESAYRDAKIDPSTIELIEAHGTGTIVGDEVEFKALNHLFSKSNKKKKSCALGSVKSMIGHTKAAAGAAGLMKAALALYDRVLPPTIKVDEPDPKLNIDKSPFYLNTESRPWFSKNKHPRRSGVSAFGFGGSNFHVVLEEYTKHKPEIAWDGSAEIFTFSSADKKTLLKMIRDFASIFDGNLSAKDIAKKAAQTRHNFSCTQPYRLLIVIENSLDQFKNPKDVFKTALNKIESNGLENSWCYKNIYYGCHEKPGKIAFLFPGQGSQYPKMGSDIVCRFPVAFGIMEKADERFPGNGLLTDVIYPPHTFDSKEKREQNENLKNTRFAQPAIGAVSACMVRVLQGFGVTPDMVCGHSFGELTALYAAGWIDIDTFLNLSITRGQLMAADNGNNSDDKGTMTAVKAPLDELANLIRPFKTDVILANRNSPLQGVLSGPTSAVGKAEKLCNQKGFKTVRLPVSAAFHSKLVHHAGDRFVQVIKNIDINPTDIPVFSNTTGLPYPEDGKEAKSVLGRHLISPVDFLNNINNIYKSGVKTFVEAGPKSVLTGLVKSTLKNRDFYTISMDPSGGKRSGISDLAGALCHLASLGYPVDLKQWETPAKDTRKQIMSIPISGSNYRAQKKKIRKQETLNTIQKNKPEPIQPGHESNRQNNKETITMENQTEKQSFILDALNVVQDGLKSMQALQSRTAQTHEKFLETQQEASRTLQSMMENTRRLAEVSLGFKPGASGIETALVPGHRDFGVKESMPEKDMEYSADITHKPHRHAKVSSQSMWETSVGSSASEQPQAFLKSVKTNIDTESKADIPRNNLKIDIKDKMLKVVSRLTGYPVEMLELDMDIEADLGIDSIKRVEILSTLEEKMPDLPTVSPEIMGTLKTLGQIVDYLSDASDTKDDTGAANPEVKDKPASIDKNKLKDKMLKVVSRLTGYPVEMLELDMDIEADLGIDSIKRVEILSTLEEKIPGLPSVSPEIMGTLKTLGQIVDYLSDVESKSSEFGIRKTEIVDQKSEVGDLRSETGNQKVEVTNLKTEVKGENKSEKDFQYDPEFLSGAIGRKIISAVPTPFHPTDILTPAVGRKILIIQDSSGLAPSIAGEFAALNIDTIIASDQLLQDILNENDGLDKIAGLVIISENQNCNDRFLKDAFLIARHFAADLLDSAENGGAFFATITCLDGAFGFKGSGIENPVQGGLAGLAKTASVEWSKVRCHAIDIAPDVKNNKDIAKKIVSELLNSDPLSPVETGFDADSRITLELTPSPFFRGKLNISEKDVFIITGGARGVTAWASRALANYGQPTLVLIGRSPAPTPEPQWLVNLTNEADIKKAILENGFAGTSPSPMELEHAFKKHMSNREISNAIHQIEQYGSNVIYYSADVRNENSINSVFEQVRTNFGPITGIIHGAGTLEDRLITDKTIEQFEKVYAPKVNGARALLKAAKNDELKFVIFFSSVAARSGNYGQVDYAMANEVLNKTALQESINRPDCKVISVNWGPWEGGMVCPALKRKFEKSGIKLIPMDAGAMCMIYEMMENKNDAVEVVIGGGLASGKNTAVDTTLACKQNTPVLLTKKDSLSQTFKREIDVDRYPVLKSHILGGKPVVPFALIAEWLGHSALHANPGLFLHGLDDMRICNGIKLDQDKKTLRFFAGKAVKEDSLFKVPVEIRNGNRNDMGMIHSKATAVLTSKPVQPPDFNLSKPAIFETYSKSLDEIYDKILFHGFDLRGIKEITGYSPEGIAARISAAPSPSRWMKEPLRSKWLLDPLVLDSAFQMAIIWCFEKMSLVCLPAYSACYRQYTTRFPSDGVLSIFEVTEVNSHKIKGDFTFLDKNNKVVAEMGGYESIMDDSLSGAFKQRNAA